MSRKIAELRLPAIATIKNTRQTMTVAGTLGVMMLIKVRKLYLRQRWLPIGAHRLSANYDATESVLFAKAVGAAFSPDATRV